MSESWFGRRQKQSAVVLALMLAGVVYMSMRGGDDSPKGQVTRAVKAMVAGAENKDIGPFREYFSENVRDESGNDKQALLNILRGIFLRHSNISLSLVSLDLQDNTNPDLISASLTLLMGETVLPTDRGNFFVTFRREPDGVWRVWEVRWQGGYGE